MATSSSMSELEKEEFLRLKAENLALKQRINGSEHISDHLLTKEQISRYSRQLILEEMGVKTQESLLSARVAVIGAGGLGCPVLLYLAAAGIGYLGIFDDDEVDESNLHRQVIHDESGARVNLSKAKSAAIAINRLNSNVRTSVECVRVSSTNAVSLLTGYDIIVDCSDNAPTRYLLSDIAVLLNKPLVSGSAIRGYGQITVYHYRDRSGECGPCYRCLFPKPSPADSSQNCSDAGVCGPLVGMIGSMQAMEVVKILSNPECGHTVLSGKMVLVDAFRCSYRTVKLRMRRLECNACGETPTVTLDDIPDYQLFCGSANHDKQPDSELADNSIQNITCQELRQGMKESKPEDYLLLDVREKPQFEICHLENALNIPLNHLDKEEAFISSAISEGKKIYVICRRGIDSMEAYKQLHKKFEAANIHNVKGGLRAWNRMDPTFPSY